MREARSLAVGRVWRTVLVGAFLLALTLCGLAAGASKHRSRQARPLAQAAATCGAARKPARRRVARHHRRPRAHAAPARRSPRRSRRHRSVRRRAGPPPHLADGRLSDWRGAPTNLAGRTQISGGELIYTDYLYDDYGPDLNGVPDPPAFRSQLTSEYGDYRYPKDPRYANNAADLRELRLAADGCGLHALISLQTMKVPDAAAATIAIDTDGNAATGATTWPDGLNLKTPGADRFITTWGTGARVTDAQGHVTAVRTAANTDENAIEVDVPYALLGPISPQARVWVVTGLAAPGGGYREQTAGKTAAFDMGFQGDDDWPRLFDGWGDHRQAEALASGDLGQFSHPLDLAAMQRRATIPFKVEPGYYNAIFRSGLRLGEGVDLKGGNPSQSSSGDANPEFLSPYQPYGLWIPQGWSPAKRNPLLIMGHSLDVNHTEYRDVSPNMLRQLGDERGSVIITPLARASDGWYLDTGLVDVFEAWNDARRRFAVDDNRTSLGGYSMGGYLSYRLGLLMPDRFARVVDYVGPPAFYFWPYPAPLQSTDEWRVAGNTNQIVDNGLNLPYEINAGHADELVPFAGVLNQVNTFKAAGDPYRFYEHSSDDHLSFILNDVWTHSKAWLGDARRDLAPTEVRYKRYPAMDLPARGLVFDGAYWVAKLVVRNAGAADAFGEIDAVNLARGGFRRKVVADTPGVSAGEGGASPATVTGQHAENGDALPRRNGLQATLTNLSSALFRTGPMGIDVTAPLLATLTGDGQTTIRFDGAWPAGVHATLDGAPVPLRREAGGGVAVTMSLPAGGAHALTVSR